MALPTETSPVGRTTGDERWERWAASGDAHDRDARYRTQVITVLIASTLAIGLALTLLFR